MEMDAALTRRPAIQFAYMCTTVGIGLVGGVIAGHFATLKCFKPTEPKNMYVDSEYWEVPHLETPYYFATNTNVTSDLNRYYPTEEVAAIAGSDQDGQETSKVEGANLDAPDNAHLLGLIHTLEVRINQLTRRLADQTGASGFLPSTAPITGVSAIPQVRHSKSVVDAADYPPSKLAIIDEQNTAAPLSSVAVHPGAVSPKSQQHLVLHDEDEEEQEEE